MYWVMKFEDVQTGRCDLSSVFFFYKFALQRIEMTHGELLDLIRMKVLSLFALSAMI